ncbi:MAG: hypothetical protein AB1414_11195 [bacterium]
MKGSSSKEKFIIWHPEVHKIYGETLYFFLLNFEPGIFGNDEYMEKIKNALELCEIKGYSIYFVFGHYDCLLRVWLKPGKETIFKRKIADTNLPIKVIDTFICEPENLSHYFWRGEKINPKEIDEKIEKYKSEDLNNLQENLDEELCKELEKQRLAFIKERGEGKIKFYIILNPPFTEHSQEDIKEGIEDVLNTKESITKAENISLYSGKGFGRFLVKGEVEKDEFYAIFHLVKNLNESKPVKMDSETLIIAKVTENEWDNVDFTKPVEKYNELIKFLEIKENEFNKLSEDTKITLLNLFFAIKEPDNVLKRIFKGVIDRDGDSIRKEMVLFFDIEDSLSKLFWVSMEKIYGPGWQIAKGGEFAEAIGKENLRDMSIYDYICLLGYMEDKGLLKYNDYPIELPKDWQVTLRKMWDWRNNLAHGRIKGDELLKAWKRVVELFIEIIPIHKALNEVIENLERRAKNE